MYALGISVLSTTPSKGICYWRSKMYFCSKVEFVDGISSIYELGTTVLVQWWESLAQGKFILGLINVICFHVWCGLSLLVLYCSLWWFLRATLFRIEHQHFDLIILIWFSLPEYSILVCLQKINVWHLWFKWNHFLYFILMWLHKYSLYY